MINIVALKYNSRMSIEKKTIYSEI